MGFFTKDKKLSDAEIKMEECRLATLLVSDTGDDTYTENFIKQLRAFCKMQHVYNKLQLLKENEHHQVSIDCYGKYYLELDQDDLPVLVKKSN